MNKNSKQIECIILAGGLGTRLRSMIGDEIPKPMAKINGLPFLEILLHQCAQSGLKHIILSTGYKAERIKEYFGANFLGLTLSYCRESSPLGTGGAIKNALLSCASKYVLVLNGDSFLDINLGEFFIHTSAQMQKDKSLLSMALKALENTRYGGVKLDSKGIITHFSPCDSNLINAGIYCIDSHIFKNFDLNECFSFEKFIQEHCPDIKPLGFIKDSEFIDIGVPQDYTKAQRFFANLKNTKSLSCSHTLLKN
ncbi:nucleotidyltransferase family protein [Helicobacter himalayensis]|uniref:nucleotidyltransferase family protein n=1 Tax=Helicobacter himalayensis TaxID=1591088 RepID=UPI0008354091|nr:nucleotidyltransferase family protein [Helicobacter himalayensis]